MTPNVCHISPRVAAFLSRLRIECLWAADEPSLGNLALLHFVNRDQFDVPRAFRKSPRHFFMIDHHVAQHDTVEECA